MAFLRWLLATWLIAFPALQTALASASDRTLIILLDGIGYQEFAQVQEEGHFSYLGPAGRMIAPFPSLTNASLVALTRRLGSSPAPGYEDYFFSRQQNRLKGGILDRLSPGFSKSSFRKVFDYHPPGYLSALEYVFPPWSCGWMLDLDLKLGLRKFRTASEERFLLYLGASDCKSHMGGLGSTRGFLQKLDRKLSRLLREYPRTRLLLLSDHGNEASEFRRIDLGKALRRAEFKIEGRLRSERSVVFPRFGLVGSAVLYTRPGRESEVAEIVAAVDGVHFAAVKKGDEVILYSGGGEPAKIRLEGDRLHYEPGSSDPLDIGSAAVHTLAEWEDSTRSLIYPNGVGRVWQMSQGLVSNPASVVVDLDRKKYIGSRWLDLFVFLRATHGNLSDAQSSGFIASSYLPVPPVVSAEEAGFLVAR